MLFIFSIAEFFVGSRKKKEIRGEEKIKMSLVSVLFGLRLTSGIAYLIKQIFGGNYY